MRDVSSRITKIKYNITQYLLTIIRCQSVNMKEDSLTLVARLATDMEVQCPEGVQAGQLVSFV